MVKAREIVRGMIVRGISETVADVRRLIFLRAKVSALPDTML
jgi:hypothetical protein